MEKQEQEEHCYRGKQGQYDLRQKLLVGGCQTTVAQTDSIGQTGSYVLVDVFLNFLHNSRLAESCLDVGVQAHRSGSAFSAE